MSKNLKKQVMKSLKHSMLVVGALLISLVSVAQGERSAIRQGNELYQAGKYAESGAKYAEALKINPLSTEAQFNLAGTAYKLGKWKEASEVYTQLADSLGSNALYNVGNSQFKQRQFDAAIEAYKKALRLNPSDREAKFNLAYAQKMKQEQDGGGGGGQNDQKQDQQDQKQDQNQQDQQKQDPKQEKQDQQQQEQKPERSDAERMLKAIQAAEDKTKDKVEGEKAAAPQRRSGKDW